MPELVSNSALADFQLMTRIDIEDQFFNPYFDFFDNQYILIVNYYNGTNSVSNEQAFSELDRLLTKSKELIDVFQLNSRRFQTYDMWILLEQLEEARESLLTVQNLPKYLRSTIDQSSFNSNTKIDISLPQGSTLENVQNQIASDDSADGWVQTALINNLTEEDYTPEGGTIIDLQLQNAADFRLNSVIKGIELTEDAYGIDIKKNIKFEDSDLQVCNGIDTIEQAANIMINLQKGDNPTYPDLGIDKTLILGRNIITATYPVLFRQMNETFETDDTFRSLLVLDIRNEQDAVFIDVELSTQAGNFAISQTLALS